VVCFLCEDDVWRDCQRRAERGECELADSVFPMLVLCRKSCREKYSGRPLPKIIKTYGGLEDYVVDPFGFKIPICAENGGKDTLSRSSWLTMAGSNEEQPAWVPKFTKVGFEKTKIPADIYAMLLWEFERQKSLMVQEPITHGIINCVKIVEMENKRQSRLQDLRRTFMTKLSPYVSYQLTDKLLPLAEEWANVKLEFTSLYGIRRYTNGSELAAHVDRFYTHIISAILNIGQSVESDWPLYIMDNDGGQHKVTMEPGDMVWYESARTIHGRQQPLQGEYYDNLFIHYKPVDSWYIPRSEDISDFEIGKKPRSTPITLQEILVKQGNSGNIF